MHEFFNQTFNGIVTSKNKTYEDVCSNFIAEEKSVEDLVLEKLGKKTSGVGASSNRVSLRLSLQVFFDTTLLLHMLEMFARPDPNGFLLQC